MPAGEDVHPGTSPDSGGLQSEECRDVTRRRRSCMGQFHNQVGGLMLEEPQVGVLGVGMPRSHSGGSQSLFAPRTDTLKISPKPSVILKSCSDPFRTGELGPNPCGRPEQRWKCSDRYYPASPGGPEQVVFSHCAGSPHNAWQQESLHRD